MIEFVVNDNNFQEWVAEVKSNFQIMMEAMIDVAEVVKAETLPRTPLDTGRLGESFKYTVLADNSKQKLVQVQMSAINPETGYDYAWIQHDDPVSRPPYHHIHGENKFLLKGIQASEDLAMRIIEQDYLSMFAGFRVVD